MFTYEVKKNKPSNSAFKQQRLKAWQPIFSKKLCHQKKIFLSNWALLRSYFKEF